MMFDVRQLKAVSTPSPGQIGSGINAQNINAQCRPVLAEVRNQATKPLLTQNRSMAFLSRFGVWSHFVATRTTGRTSPLRKVTSESNSAFRLLTRLEKPVLNFMSIQGCFPPECFVAKWIETHNCSVRFLTACALMVSAIIAWIRLKKKMEHNLWHGIDVPYLHHQQFEVWRTDCPSLQSSRAIIIHG